MLKEMDIDELWNYSLKNNSYTKMGHKIQFDKIADMVLDDDWNMRDKAMLTIKVVSKFLTIEKKVQILLKAGVDRDKIEDCWLKQLQKLEEKNE